MELYDSDEEHLKSVLREDDEPENDDVPTPPQETSLPPRLQILQETVQVTEREEDDERYRLLPEYTRKSGFVWDGTPSSQQGEDVVETNKSAAEIVKEEPFKLSEDERKNIPENITTPTSKRLNEIIKLTAQKAALTPQFEVLLKVKQSDNADFCFLSSSHALHPYYQLLKERLTPSELKRKEPESNTTEDEGAIMGGLLGMYSSSSEDEADGRQAGQDTTPATEEVTATLKNDESIVSDGANSRNSTNEQKAKRLKRAKMMKGHFALKLMKDSHNKEG